MADDPAEELFAGVAVWEAAIGGVCAFEMELLMDSVVGERVRSLACAIATGGLAVSSASSLNVESERQRRSAY